MKGIKRSAEELNQCREDFLLQPHKVIKLREMAKKIWDEEQNYSEKNSVDRWAMLIKHTIKNDKGKDRPFGTEIVFALRTHLALLQGNKCCYCRRWLQNVAPARPVEHILSRDDYPQFSMHYWNLAVCCRDCNQLKSNKNWSLLPKNAKVYPSDVLDYFHPRIHIYDGHIRYIRVETNNTSIAIYHGLTDQGRQLCREHLKTVSQVDALFQNNPRISAAVKRLQSAGESATLEASVKLREFIDSIHQAVHRIAERT